MGNTSRFRVSEIRPLTLTLTLKIGVERTVPVVPYCEGDKVYVIASMGGQPEHPAWYRVIPVVQLVREG